MQTLLKQNGPGRSALKHALLAAALILSVTAAVTPAKADWDHDHGGWHGGGGYHGGGGWQRGWHGQRHWYHGQWIYNPYYQSGYVAPPPAVIYPPPEPVSPGLNLIVPIHIR